jgi:hypothetical protein
MSPPPMTGPASLGIDSEAHLAVSQAFGVSHRLLFYLASEEVLYMY